MKLSTKARYGARAMVVIARNQKVGVRTRRKDICEEENIPTPYLENILTELKNRGLLRTIRGPQGGFELTRDPKDITMLEIVECLQGDLAPIDCLGDEGCDNEIRCSVRNVWKDLRDAQIKVLESHTLEELIPLGVAAVGVSFDQYMGEGGFI
jgi:Rrf2 family transcriptional regulator, cysteine metabolism repressor